MKKRIASFLLAAAVAMTGTVVPLVSAYGYDNNGDKYNYMYGATIRVSNPSSYFPSGSSTVSGVSKNIYDSDGTCGKFTPEYNREIFGSNKIRSYIQNGPHGVKCDGIVSCAYGTAFSEVSRFNVHTKWVKCYNSASDFSGYIYKN